jgi:hypothetical protein
MRRPPTTTAAVSPNEQFAADAYSVPVPPTGTYDPTEAFAVFAAVPSPIRAARGRVDPQDRGERLRDEPLDDWQQDRLQDRYDTTIYGSDQ